MCRTTKIRSKLKFVLGLGLLAVFTAAHAYDVDELSARNAEAKGGLAKLQNMSTLTRRGKLIVNGGQLKLDFVQMQKRAGMVREEATMQGLTVVQAFDGEDGWQINPFQGKKTAERTPLDDNKSLIEDAEIEGPLVDYKAKHYQLQNEGTEDVDGTLALKIKVTRPGGDIQIVFLDPDHFLEIRTVSRRSEHGVPVEIQTDYGDYEQVGGVYFPFSIVSQKKGASDKQVVQFDTGEANPEIEDAKFHFPEPHVNVGKIQLTNH